MNEHMAKVSDDVNIVRVVDRQTLTTVTREGGTTATATTMTQPLEESEPFRTDQDEGEDEDGHEVVDFDLPQTIETRNGRSGAARPLRQPSYLTVDNPAVHWTQQQKASLTWIKVLGVLAVALLIDVIILTVYVYTDTEPKGYAARHNLPPLPQLSWKPLPEESETLTSLVFGSCASQYMPQPHWDTLVQYNPDLVVLTGDNVYGDCANASCANLHQAYLDWSSLASFRGGQSALSVVATLDDHDYGQSDCHADNPHKETAKEMFWDFFQLDEKFRRPQEGVYQSYAFGPPDQRTQLILLDTRYSRSPFQDTDEPHAPNKEAYVPTNDTTAQMLSPTQWNWLEDQLASETAQVRVIVSSVQVLSNTGFECWRMIPSELQRLEDLLQKYKENSAILLVSGDRHMGAMYEKEGLVELTASSWTHTIPLGTFQDCDTPLTCDETDPHRMGDMVRVNNFGSLEIDWEAKEIRIALRRAQATAAYRYHETGDQHTDAGMVVQSHTFYIP